MCFGGKKSAPPPSNPAPPPPAPAQQEVPKIKYSDEDKAKGAQESNRKGKSQLTISRVSRASTGTLSSKTGGGVNLPSAKA